MTIPNKSAAILLPVAWHTPLRQYGAWETVASNITKDSWPAAEAPELDGSLVDLDGGLMHLMEGSPGLLLQAF